MKLALEVNHNGRVLCVAGGSEVNLLLAILYLSEPDKDTTPDYLEICGDVKDAHLIWSRVPLHLDDVIVIRIVDSETHQITKEDERQDESEITGAAT